MKSPYRALLWEQTRTAGVLCAATSGLAVLFQVNMWAMVFTRQVFADDAAAVSVTGSLWVLLLAAALILVRQDGWGNVAVDFEPRLLHLPVVLLPTLLIVFVSRIAFLACTGVIVLTACRYLHGPLPDWGMLVLALHTYLAAQTCIWIRHSITGLSYTLPAVALGVAAPVYYFGPDPAYWKSTGESLQYFLPHPGSLFASFSVFFFISFLGLKWQRADERRGLPPLGDLLAALNEWRSSRVRRFLSPLEAQLWFEQRRIGRLLPALTLLFTAALAALFTIAPDLIFDADTRYWNAPYLGLLAAAMVCGPIGLRPRSRFPFQRPQTTTSSAMAILLIQIRALYFCFVLVSALSFLGMLVEGYDGVLMLQMLRMGDMDWLMALDHVLRPAFSVTLIAWALLWFTTWSFSVPLISFAIVYYLLPTLFYDSRFFIGAWISQAETRLFDVGFTLPIIVVVFWMVFVTAGLTLKRGLYRFRHLVWGIVLFQNMALALLLITPYLGMHVYAVTACAAIAALVLLPFTAAPLSLLHYRLKS